MKKALFILGLLAVTMSAFGQSTIRRQIIDTSRFSREINTNETADGWLRKLGSSITASNVFVSAAGTNITIVTNGYVYTISSSTDTNGLASTNYVGQNYVTTPTFTNALANVVGLPYIICYANSNYLYQGVIHSNLTSTTCGIQEAINALPQPTTPDKPGGGTILFGPGTFYTYNTIITPYLSNLAFTLDFEGCGMSACGITYIGAFTNDVLRIGYPGTRNALIFNMQHMWVASAVNGLTNVVYLNGPAIVGNDSAGAGMAEAYIRNCWFGYWPTMTNNNPFTPSSNPPNQKQNLVLLNINLNSDNIIAVENCTFQCGAVGVVFTCDHGAMVNNTFQNIGFPGSVYTTNDWPANTIFAQGPAVVFKEPGDGLQVINDNKAWDLQDFTFVNCPLHYYAVRWTGVDGSGHPTVGPFSPTNQFFSRNSIIINRDTDENGAIMAITSGQAMVINDTRALTNNPWFPLPSYQMTNFQQFNYSNCIRAPYTTVRMTSSLYGTNSGAYAFGGDVRANNGFILSSNSWTNVPALNYGDNWYASSNGVPHVIWLDQGGTRHTNRLVP